MSGILKRKLDEGPSPYLSLQGSEDDEVSCSDSGNSSDSLNHSVPAGILDGKSLRSQLQLLLYFSPQGKEAGFDLTGSDVAQPGRFLPNLSPVVLNRELFCDRLC